MEKESNRKNEEKKKEGRKELDKVNNTNAQRKNKRRRN